MTEKEFLNLFNIKEIKDAIKESDIKDFYITNKTSVYSLRECLESIDDKILKHVYVIHKHVLSKDKNLKDNPTQIEMINTLESEIKNSFSLFLISLEKDDKETLNEIVKNKKTDKININLLSNGFMFGFKENNRNVYIIPNELLNIYNEFKSSDTAREHDLSTANMYILAYIVMNGVLEIKYIKDLLINEYSLNITEDEIDEIIKKNYEIYKSKYFITSDLKNSLNDITDELIKQKKKIPSFKLNETELFYYLSMINNFTKELSKILKNHPKGFEDLILLRCSLVYQPLEQIIDEFKFTKNERKKVLEVLEKYENNFRYWVFNGRTIDEYDKLYFTEHYFINSKPKSNDLKNCLNKVSKELLQFFKDYYEVNTIEELMEAILDNAKETFKQFSINEIESIINSNNDELTDDIPIEFLKCGFVILYKEDNKIKYFIPKEVLDISKIEVENNEQIYIDNLIAGYININGVLKKEKLQKLLKKHHDIDFSIKQLDKIIKNVEAEIIDNSFYTYIVDINQEDIKKFIISKEIFDKYKEVNFFDIDEEDEFKDQLQNLISRNLQLNFKADDIYQTIIFMTKTGTFSRDSLNFVFDDYNIELKKELEKEIMSLYNKYKEFISVWLYNGYSITEFNEMNKTKKIGRNEPCPCGSGKKYKKCCGK